MVGNSASSTWPLYGAAGIAFVAILFAWPEPLAGGWEWASLSAAVFGIVGSMPFWRAAQAEQQANRKPGFGGLILAIMAGMLVAVTMVHLGNAALSPGPVREAVLNVTDKYVTRGRRGRQNYRVVTTPVPGDSDGVTVHGVGGLASTSGSFGDYTIGGCMALKWRPGWLWPVVVSRAASPCPPQEAPASPSALPLARPGPAWPSIQQRLAGDIAVLPLPPQGVRIELRVSADNVGRITAITPMPGSAPLSPIATEIVEHAIMRQPGALTQAGEYRLWLLLRPAGDRAGTDI
jgi:hypothetical protein